MMTVIYAIFDEKLLIYYYRKERFARKKFIFIINFFNSQSMMIESKVTYKFKLIWFSSFLTAKWVGIKNNPKKIQ